MYLLFIFSYTFYFETYANTQYLIYMCVCACTSHMLKMNFCPEESTHTIRQMSASDFPYSQWGSRSVYTSLWARPGCSRRGKSAQKHRGRCSRSKYSVKAASTAAAISVRVPLQQSSHSGEENSNGPLFI